MDEPCGIVVFGANGGGKTTLGRELARLLGFWHIDHEAYHFLPADMPYTAARSAEACRALMLADIEAHGSFVLSAVTGDFGEDMARMYRLAVYITAPPALRLERIERRELERHGSRVQAGGDMREQHAEFLRFVAARSQASIEKWAQTLACPIIHVDGTGDWRVTAADIARRFRALPGPLA